MQAAASVSLSYHPLIERSSTHTQYTQGHHQVKLPFLSSLHVLRGKPNRAWEAYQPSVASLWLKSVIFPRQHVEARPFCSPLFTGGGKNAHTCTCKWRHTQVDRYTDIYRYHHSSCGSPSLVSPCDRLGWHCPCLFPFMRQSRTLPALCDCCRGRAKTHTHTHILQLLAHIFSTHHPHDTTTVSTIIQAASPSLPLP